jgi:carbamoyl-phosphate synthase large subunit
VLAAALLADAEMQAELRRQTIVMARALNVVGLMNVQFAIAVRGLAASSTCSR